VRVVCGPFIDTSRLAQLQAALARLYTDAGAREELRRAPEEFAARHRLSKEETSDIMREMLGEVDAFARALQRKRFGEAARAMPIAQEILGVRIAALFEDFAALTPLGAARNPALDALAFEQWLLDKNRTLLPAAENDALRYELAWLMMQHTKRRALVRWIVVPRSKRASRVLVVWWRWRGCLRHWAGG
jgi:hypothetical protein